MRVPAIPLLALVAVAASAADDAAPPATPPAAAAARAAAIRPPAPAEEGDRDDIEVIRHGQREGTGFEWELGAAAVVGLERRLSGGLSRDREDGHLFDGRADARVSQIASPPIGRFGASPRLREFAIVAGTDAQAADDGRAMVAATARERGWRGEMPLYEVAVTGGWSDERDGLAGGDLVVGPAHVGVEHEKAGTAYRVGLKYLSPPRPYGGELSVDRIVSYLLDDRFYATETRAALHLPLSDAIGIALGVAYCHGARDVDGHLDHTWEGSLALRWMLGGGF